jgi:hypothetical protein
VVNCALSPHAGNDLLPVRVERLLDGVVHEVQVELRHPLRLDLADLGDVLLGVTEYAETIDDFVRHELGVPVIDPAVVGVVVTFPGPDVIGQRVRDLAVLAVAADEIGHVVARPSLRTTGTDHADARDSARRT